MNSPRFSLALAVIAAGLCTGLVAQSQPAFAEISIAYPGEGPKVTSKSEYITLVVEGPALSFEGTIIPPGDVVTYVNRLLADKKVSYIGLYTREGSKYGDLVRAVDTLRGTHAKQIGISISELPLGRQP